MAVGLDLRNYLVEGEKLVKASACEGVTFSRKERQLPRSRHMPFRALSVAFRFPLPFTRAPLPESLRHWSQSKQSSPEQCGQTLTGVIDVSRIEPAFVSVQLGRTATVHDAHSFVGAQPTSSRSRSMPKLVRSSSVNRFAGAGDGRLFRRQPHTRQRRPHSRV